MGNRLSCYLDRNVTLLSCYLDRNVTRLSCYLDRNVTLLSCYLDRNVTLLSCYLDRNVTRLSCYRVGTMLVGILTLNVTEICQVGYRLSCYCDRNLSAGTPANPIDIYVNRGAVHVTTLNHRRPIGRNTFNARKTPSFSFHSEHLSSSGQLKLQYSKIHAASLNNMCINFVIKRVFTLTSDSWRMISPPSGQRCATQRRRHIYWKSSDKWGYDLCGYVNKIS